VKLQQGINEEKANKSKHQQQQRSNISMKLNKCFTVTVLILALTALMVTAASALPVFSGDVPADFTAADVVQFDDPIDVGVADTAPPGIISGWDIASIYFDYEVDTDIMYVGIDCYGICGDADGDGNPANTAAWMSALWGQDLPDLSGTENIGLLIDTNNDGTFEVVVGVSALTDIYSFGAYKFVGIPLLPGFGFGPPLANATAFYASPSGAAPDLEFSIADFSMLPDLTFTSGGSFEFYMRAFAGSLQDDGVGEDFVEGYVSGADLTIIGDTVWFDTDGDGFWAIGVEPGIPGVVLNLYLDVNGNGELDGDDQSLASQTTDSDGQYLFTDIDNGNYIVEVAPENFDAGGALEGLVQTVDRSGSDQDGANRMTPWAVTIADLEAYLKADFGYRQVTNPGAGTPGYWKNHPEAWPVDEITIGGVFYDRGWNRKKDKETAVWWMDQDDKHDKTITMFRSLVAAKLNVLIGNDSSCIADTILAADAWMATYGPVGSGVRANSAAWKDGEPLYLELDDYNNGFLCAPARD
jgi:hypothetical protein